MRKNKSLIAILVVVGILVVVTVSLMILVNNKSKAVTTCPNCGVARWSDGECLNCGYRCKHNYVEGETIAATCTKNGSTKMKCSICGRSYNKVLAATGHNYAAATCTKPATCKKCGDTTGSALGHNMQETDNYAKSADGHKVEKKCSRCSRTEFGSLENHNWSNGVCSICEYGCQHTSTTGYAHDANEHWQVCNECLLKINKGNHNYSNGVCNECEYECVHTNKTTTSNGAASHKIECNTCHQVWSQNHVNWTDGKCSDCGYECEHTGGTHKNDGYCTVCGEQYQLHYCDLTHPDEYVVALSGGADVGHVERYYCEVEGCEWYEYGSTPFPHRFMVLERGFWGVDLRYLWLPMLLFRLCGW